MEDTAMVTTAHVTAGAPGGSGPQLWHGVAWTPGAAQGLSGWARVGKQGGEGGASGQGPRAVLSLPRGFCRAGAGSAWGADA